MTSSNKRHVFSEIIKNIYGYRERQVYVYGLAESKDKSEFKEKRWNALSPGFYNWFVSKTRNQFIESLIQQVREEIEGNGLFYQNDIELCTKICQREYIKVH